MEIIVNIYNQAIAFIYKNWDGMLVSILSAGLLATIVWTFSWLITSLRSRKYKAVLGEFHMYGFDTSNKGKVDHGIMNIYKRWGKIRATENHHPFYYRGTVSLTGKNIFITMEGKEHGEHLNYVFNEPLMKNIKKLWGVRSCISVNRIP